MKALSLTQPWATLVAIGAKRIETRSWSTTYRGPIAIHAAKGFPGVAKRFCEVGIVRRALGFSSDADVREILKTLPLGCMIATANLVRCVPSDSIRAHVNPFTIQEECFGDYSPRRFGFLLDNIIKLPEPVPARGALGLWEWERQA